MQNFRFHAYTNMLFGKGQIQQLPEVLNQFGKNVLLIYGGGSIKKNGIYNHIMELTKDKNIFELSGVEPNPRITTVRDGVSICKADKIDVILAVGGGSTIDCSKIIAAGACYDGDAWDLVNHKAKIEKALPIVTILTLAATGSEMNGNAVITNLETEEKLGVFSWELIPQASICDPEYLYSLPAIQTAAGTADIISHVLEVYFKKETGAFVQDRFSEGVLKTCFKYCKQAIEKPDDYEARANLMWASTMAINGLCECGKPGAWTCHPIEHELSAFYDITHGVGLAIITPQWMRYVLDDTTVDKFVDYAINVWNLSKDVPSTKEEKFAIANEGIDKTEQFFKECGIPMTLTEVGIDDSKFEEMAQNSVRVGGLSDAYKPLTPEDVVKILKMSL